METEILIDVDSFFSEMKKRVELGDRLLFIRKFQEALNQTSPEKQADFEADYQQYKQLIFTEMDKLMNEIQDSKSFT
ncbi:MAG: hypothetical protein H7Y04_05645 [Verrucomicrobia bacterium]|nr:hypothetical protein [Cytophagales bacterium]